MTVPHVLPGRLSWSQPLVAAGRVSSAVQLPRRAIGRTHASRTRAPPSRRHYRHDASSSPGIDIEAVRAEMLARPPQLTWDVMRPTNSYMLNVALADFLPASCQPSNFQLNGRDDGAVKNLFCMDPSATSAGTRSITQSLPPGHHLVYFPPQIPASGLCPDGTDPYHSPGRPFTRRMWAGGSITGFSVLGLDGRPAVCFERIEDVRVKGGGPGQSEKIFVDVRREYLNGVQIEARWDEQKKSIRPVDEDTSKEDPGAYDEHSLTGLVERRTLVFMRDSPPGKNNLTGDGASAPPPPPPSSSSSVPSPEQIQPSNVRKDNKTPRVVRAPHAPTFSLTLTPTPTLLFHYSALTFNAHSIHLDRAYCREVEGHRNLLVHGPLSLTLMLSVLRSQVEGKHESIESVEYRNLAPLYVGEPLRVCVRLNDKGKETEREAAEVQGGTQALGRSGTLHSQYGRRRSWDVWVENEQGGLSVRGTVKSWLRS